MKTTLHQNKAENFFNNFKKVLNSRINEEALAKQKVTSDMLAIKANSGITRFL